jgi:rRNA maturation protein Nop10
MNIYQLMMLKEIMAICGENVKQVHPVREI